MLTELTIKEFIHKVISNDPVPGGGSVSAFNGALATSLAAWKTFPPVLRNWHVNSLLM